MTLSNLPAISAWNVQNPPLPGLYIASLDGDCDFVVRHYDGNGQWTRAVLDDELGLEVPSAEWRHKTYQGMRWLRAVAKPVGTPVPPAHWAPPPLVGTPLPSWHLATPEWVEPLTQEQRAELAEVEVLLA